MTRARTAAAVSALLLALTGCADDAAGPAAAPSRSSTSSTAATPAAAVDDRAVCRTNANATGDLDLAPSSNMTNGGHAAQSSNPGIAQAGRDLVEVATAAQFAEDESTANLDIRQAQRDLAEACSHLLGDGPW